MSDVYMTGLGDGDASKSSTGPGTIGTGTYGRIGHGSGTGTGYGVDDGGAGAPATPVTAVPNIGMGQPVGDGPLDKAIIRRSIKRNIKKLEYCYEKQLLVKPGIAGTILAQFFIAPSGEVTHSTASGFDPDVAGCIASVIQTIRFAKPKGKDGVQVSYPFVFRSDDASMASKPASGSLDKVIVRKYIKRNLKKITYCYEKQLLVTPSLEGTIHTHFSILPSGRVSSATATGFDPTVASCVASVIRGIQFPKPAGGGGLTVNYPFVFHSADTSAPKSPDATPPPPAAAPPHVADASEAPSTANPLRAQESELAECFRKGPVPYGAAVVEMHYDAAGAVSSASVYGLDDATVRACVIDVVERLPPAAKRPGTQRCSLAFGHMPPGALAAIGIANGAVTFAGQPLAASAASTGTPDLDALGTALAARHHAAEATPDVLSRHEPIAVRPAGATPMKLVYDVIDRVVMAGEDFVLARDDTGSRLLPDMALPVVPVPRGTGGGWARIKRVAPRGAPTRDPDDQPVTLSVYITQDRVWLGLSRVDELQQVPRGPDSAKAIATALEAHKASAFFADRTGIEIAADDDVSYADVVGMIDAATAAGFTGWILVRPDALAARPMK